MDDPSPMMRFLPPALCAKSSERALQEETVGLDRLCFHTAFFHVFSAFTGERHKKKHAAIADIAAMLRAFRKQHSVVFSTLPFKLDTKQRWVPDPAQLAPATEAMTTFGRACYSKQTCPFSRSGPKDADFILKTVASVARVSDRISALWPADLKRTLPMALPAVYHRMLDANWDADTERCKQLSSLVLETSTLACYHLLYLELPKAKRQDPTDGTVRCLFWNAAFFYSQLHAMWDQQLDRLDEAVDRHIQATSDIRAELVDTTCKTMARITAKDTALRKLDAQLQRTPKSDPDARDVLEGKRQELADLNVAAFNFDPKHDIQSELDSVLRIVTFLQMEVRALPLTYPTLVVTSETQGPYKPPRCNAQEPAAAAPQPPPSQQIDAMMGEMGNLFQSDDAFWAAQLGDKKKKKRRKNRRGPDELLAALTLDEVSPPRRTQLAVVVTVPKAGHGGAADRRRAPPDRGHVSAGRGGAPPAASPRGRAHRGQDPGRRRPRAGRHHPARAGVHPRAVPGLLHVPRAPRLRQGRRPLPHVLRRGLVCVRPVRRQPPPPRRRRDARRPDDRVHQAQSEARV